MERKLLHWSDYVVFVASLVASLTVGVYHGVRNRRRQTTEAYLMANRTAGLVPVTLSLFVSWFSALSVLGDPAEAYYYGSVYWYLPLGHALCLITTIYFAPKFRELKLTSGYELLETRYGKCMRIMGSGIYNIATTVYLALALYAPAIGMSQMTGISVYTCIAVIGAVCMIYTTVGGMAAVLWVDVLQCFVMLAGLIAVLTCGVVKVGGLNEVVTRATANGRDTFNTYNPDPLVRASFWTYFVGGYFRAFKSYIGEQITIQRYCIADTKRTVVLCILLQIPLTVFLMVLFGSIGMTMSAYYYDCDPLASGQIEKSDQLLPLFAIETLGQVPGLPGLFMAAFVCAALSTLSSQHNCMMTLALKDFILPCLKTIRGKITEDRVAARIGMLLCFIIGVMNILIALPVYNLKDTGVFGLSALITGAMKGPLSACLFLAIICPLVDNTSAVLSFLIGNGVSIWLVIGTIVYPSDPQRLPVNIDGCNITRAIENVTSIPTTSFTTQTTLNTPSGWDYRDLYRLAPIQYGTVSIIFTVIVGVFFGLLSKLFRFVSDRKQREELCDEGNGVYTMKVNDEKCNNDISRLD